MWRDRLGQISLATTTLFWGAGATLQFIVIEWASKALGFDMSQASLLQGVVAVGIAIGAVLAARYVTLRGSVNVLPIGIAMGFVVMAMIFVTHLPLVIVLMILIGACAGFFVVPMNALLQHRGHVLMGAGHSIAVQNFNENIGILVMVGLYALLIRMSVSANVAIIMFGLFVSGSMALVLVRHRMNQAAGDSLHLIGIEKEGPRRGQARVVAATRPVERASRSSSSARTQSTGRSGNSFAPAPATRGKMLRKQRADPRDSLFGPLRKMAVAKRRFHRPAHRFPFRRSDLAVDAAVGDDFYIAVGEQQVDEHAGVVLGVPDPHQAEDFERAFARRQRLEHASKRQRRLDDKADLAAMVLLAGRDGRLDARITASGNARRADRWSLARWRQKR